MILAERAARMAAEAKAAEASAVRQGLTLEIERLKLEIARLRRERFGPSAERSARLEQLELSLEDLEEAAAEADAAQAPDAGETTEVGGFTRRKPARRPLPEHLPRTRVVYPAPAACPCCGGRVRKLGEVVTESLERVPARWFVIQHVREKVSCRSCEAIAEAPAPFHPIARGRAGPNLLAEVIFAKYGLHLPLHRQSERFAREGVPIEVSTLADWVGAVSVALKPLVEAIKAHVLASARIHADDTPVPVLAKGKTRTGRLWTVVRDDRPFGGHDPPAAAVRAPVGGPPPAGGGFLLLAGSEGRTRASLSDGLRRGPASRCFLGLWAALRGRSSGRRDHRGSLLGARAPQALRDRRVEESSHCDRGGAAHRCPVCDRARDQRHDGRGPAGGAGQPLAAACNRAGGVAAGAPSEAIGQV